MLLIDILLNVLYYVINVYTFCVVAVTILNLFSVNPTHPAIGFLNAMVTPPCRMLARKFPKLLVRNEDKFYDLSPMALIVLLGCLLVILDKVIIYLSYSRLF